MSRKNATVNALGMGAMLFSTWLVGIGPAVAQTPYGDCSNTAQYYQGRYQQRGQASDLVCFRHALKREFSDVESAQASRPPSPTRPSALGRIEVWCQSMQDGQSEESCMTQQVEAQVKLESFLAAEKANGRDGHDALSSCSYYTTGGMGSGSMGLEDLVPVASCVSMPPGRAKSIFHGCVQMVSGVKTTGDEIPPSVSSGDSLAKFRKIKMCFLSQLP